MTPDQLKSLRALCEAATPGPWQWYGNTKTYEVYLATKHSGRRFVMDFARWGMGSAQPRFQVTIDGDASGAGVMRSLVDLAGGDARAKEKGLDLPALGPLFEVDYRRQFVGIGHPDAAFIAAARQAVPVLIEEVETLRMAFSDLADDICGLQPVVTPDDAIKAISQRDFQLRQENESLRTQLSALEKHVAHNDDEYRTMKDILRAEHQECERLRGQLSAMTAARDEACDWAIGAGDKRRLYGLMPDDEQRIAALRKVGQ